MKKQYETKKSLLLRIEYEKICNLSYTGYPSYHRERKERLLDELEREIKRLELLEQNENGGISE